MPTNEERQEVAARLRGDPYDTLIPYRTGIHFGMGCHEAANRFWDMCERIKSAGDYDIAYSTRYVLADLIEPEPERKAKSKPFPIEKDTGYFDTTKCECGYLNDVSATYCGQCGGVIEVVE